MNFESFKLDARLGRGLQNAGYKIATPIQAAAIPAVLEGHDLIGTAQTGTGKTAAFVLPILHKLLAREKTGQRGTRALIITPTRELAEQINEVVQALGKFTPIKSATVYGGVGMEPQTRALRQGIEVIVACPGRLLDHLNRRNAKLDQVEFLVLDEADRMLDMGFLPSIQEIIRQVAPQRQTLLFSATFDAALEKLIHNSLRRPKRFSMGIEAPASTVTHTLYPVSQHLKTNLLLKLLPDMTADSILLFTRTKHRADRVADKISRAGYRTATLHADKSQSQRKSALDQFRAGRIQILVATDIAARGLDVSTISHVINYDIPDCATAYIHRIGRTGRAERSGDALTLVTHEDKVLLRDIEKILGRPIERRVVEGFNYDERKKDDMPRSKPQSSRQPSPAFWSEKEARAKKRGQSSSKDRNRWENFYQAA